MLNAKSFLRLQKVALLVLMLALVIVLSGASKAPTPEASVNEPDGPFQSEPELLSPDGGVGMDDSTALSSTGNPWGCGAKSDYPHESTRNPGPGWIQAKSHTRCTVPPPASSVWTITQELYRSSWTGWRLEAYKVSSCPFRIGAPTCKVSSMTAYINWDCEAGTLYHYKVQARHQLTVHGEQYGGYSSAQTGQPKETGTVYCSQ